MDRFGAATRRSLWALLLGLGMLSSATGCGRALATLVYVIKGNEINAEFDGLKDKRVVVVCRPPASLEYRYGGADRQLAKRVGELLAANVKKIDLVKPSEVENWTDQRDGDDVKELAEAVNAQIVVRIDLEDFELEKGPTLYQGKADTVITVFDMDDEGREIWQKSLGEFFFPVNSAVPAQEKPLEQFRRQFTTVLSEQIARHFYPHDARIDFASDGLAHR